MMQKICRSCKAREAGRDDLRRGGVPCLTLVTAAALWIGLSEPALAYVGPGAGLGAIGAFLGLVATVLLTLGVLVLWPVRRFLRWVRNKPAVQTPDAGGTVPGSDGAPLEGRAPPEDRDRRR